MPAQDNAGFFNVAGLQVTTTALSLRALGCASVTQQIRSFDDGRRVSVNLRIRHGSCTQVLRGAISIANSLPAHSDERKVASWERALKGMVIANGDGGVVKPYDAAPDNASQATPET